VTYRNYEGMIHGFFWMLGALDQARTVMDEVGKEVRAALGTT
jgi:acetyl esterase